MGSASSSASSRSKLSVGGRSGPDGGRLEGHSAGAPHQEQLEVDHLGRAVVILLRAHAGEAVAQAPVERAEALPFQAVDRISGRVGLRYDVARKPPPPVVVVTL